MQELLLCEATTEQVAKEFARRGLELIMAVETSEPGPQGNPQVKLAANVQDLDFAKQMLYALGDMVEDMERSRKGKSK